MKANNILLGTLAGLSVGLLLGVLFTSDTGSETKKKMAAKKKKSPLDKLSNATCKQSGDLIEKTTDFTQDGMENLSELQKDILGIKVS